MFDLIAFDADDTLWHTESLYVDVQGKLKELLAPYHEPEWVEARLYETEMREDLHCARSSAGKGRLLSGKWARAQVWPMI